MAFGTCSDVFKGRCRESGELVAMKRIKVHRQDYGFPVNTIREIKSLRTLRHQNIVRLRSIVTGRDQAVYLVFDYCEYDLAALLIACSLSELQIRCYIRQIFIALRHLSDNRWMHRDLKPANILITQANVVKLADFGLAKQLDGVRPTGLTNEVITIWYRPPELLLGADSYGTEIDIWSAGCIFYEIITRTVLFPTAADNVALEIESIFTVHGFPGPDVWKVWEKFPAAASFRQRRFPGGADFAEYLDRHLPPRSELAKDLIIRMLEYDSAKRISIGAILAHPYIVMEAVAPEALPILTLAETHLQMPRQQQNRQPPAKRNRAKRAAPRPPEIA
jgi:serine/threonine protein kinase